MLTRCVCVCVLFVEDMLQHAAGVPGIGGREERREEEHDRWCPGQRTHTKRSVILFPPVLLSLSWAIFLVQCLKCNSGEN